MANEKVFLFHSVIQWLIKCNDVQVEDLLQKQKAKL